MPEQAPGAGLWINDSNLSLEAARLGLGVALERRSVEEGLLQRGELVALTDLHVPYAYPYWLVWPPATTELMADFVRWMREQAKTRF